MPNKILKFPEIEYILKCKYCGSNTFHIKIFNSIIKKIVGYRCSDCNEEWDIKK